MDTKPEIAFQHFSLDDSLNWRYGHQTWCGIFFQNEKYAKELVSAIGKFRRCTKCLKKMSAFYKTKSR